MSKRGVIVGKFYPPHRGHKYLIDTGRSQVEQLTVILCWKPGENPPGWLRAEWLREIHPDVNVIALEDTLPDDDTQAWAENTLKVLGYVPEVVFTSEDYGEPYATHMGCRHVEVDKARRVVPVSGTAVRANPLQGWDFLEPCVRAFYAKRVCLVGAESTGKTTLAATLAGHYHTAWVAEYGREYSEKKLLGDNSESWESVEFEHIAREQSRLEDVAARQANRLLICDTDAFATSIWHRRYLNRRSPVVEAIDNTRRYDLYLLTDVNIPFVRDGFRDGEHIREWMHQLFEEELKATGRVYALVTGTPEERLSEAIRLIDPLLKE